MHYLLIYDLEDDYLERRTAFRTDHLNLARQAVQRGELLLGGALDEPPDRAVLLFTGPSAERAENFARADPYVLNGLVRKWRVSKWTTVVGPGASSPVEVPNAGKI